MSRTVNRRTRGYLAATAVAALGTGVLTVVPAASAGASTTDDVKNVIVLISDGAGYNQFDAASLYETGKHAHQVTVDPTTGAVQQADNEPVQSYDSWPVVVGQSHFSANGRANYSPEAAWGDFGWVASGATDSAAAGTALGTGVKTNNGFLGLTPDGTRLLTLGEQAKAVDKAVGLVTSVNFNHATPAGFIAHNADRNDYQGLATEMIDSGVDVLMGAGHPNFDDAGRTRAPDNTWISAVDFTRVAGGQTDFTYMDAKSDFDALAAGDDVPEKVFGLVQAANTLQYNRPGLANANVAPYTDPAIANVPTLETMTKGALNVLEQDEDGFFLMVEGGAVDWAGHANQTTRLLEEQLDFNDSVEAVEEWVEANSSWDETLVIVTADHETGYLAGAGAGPDAGWTPMTGTEGELPQLTWHSGGHTNALVPLFAKGAGSDALQARATGWDLVRGAYLDNTDVGEVVFDALGHKVGESPDAVGVQAQVGGQGAAGALTMSVASDGVETLLSGSGDQLTGELPEVTVEDSRTEAQAQGRGWTVSGTATDLVAGNRSIGAESLSWVPKVLESQSDATPNGPATLQAPAALAETDRQTRVGLTVLGADLLLAIPAEARAGNYGSEITMSLFAKD